MLACNYCWNKRAEDFRSDDLKTHVQITVPATSAAAYVEIGYTVIARDEHTITIRKPLYPSQPEPQPIRKLNY